MYRKSSGEWKEEMNQAINYVREHFEETRDVEPQFFDIDSD